MVRTLAAVAKPNTREGISANLVRVFEKTDKAVLLIDSLNSDEIDSTRMWGERGGEDGERQREGEKIETGEGEREGRTSWFTFMSCLILFFIT